MAFIVPLMKKDYALYGQRRSNSVGCAPRRVGSANGVPAKSPRMPRLSLDENSSNMMCSSSSSTPDSSASTSPVSTVPYRRQSKRISIRNLDENGQNPEASPNFSRLTPDDPIKRHVHFGFCEEIQYGSDEEEEEAAPAQPSGHMSLRKANSLPAEATTPLVGVLRHRNDSQISVQKSKMASVFKWVRLCAPKN